ncbi:hypothetical protein M8A51_11880 [Schlegelella sp. S2-27]|uniref:Uncharacterized protein n=1 Tax=Caldimonas mangrovi TaxID=2944811 RepID=A0ABT0YNE3_9BURK|nr:hypothetical protein [Caldimonas mangrovi]MCM5680231.1 hypothetical protein [Caldimonas mangrovi]
MQQQAAPQQRPGLWQPPPQIQRPAQTGVQHHGAPVGQANGPANAQSSPAFQGSPTAGSQTSATPPGSHRRRTREEIEAGVPRRDASPGRSTGASPAGTGGLGAALDSGDWRKALKLGDVPDASDMAMLVQSCAERQDMEALLGGLRANRESVDQQVQALASAAQGHPSGPQKLQEARTNALKEIGDAENYVREQMAWRFPQR